MVSSSKSIDPTFPVPSRTSREQSSPTVEDVVSIVLQGELWGKLGRLYLCSAGTIGFSSRYD